MLKSLTNSIIYFSCSHTTDFVVDTSSQLVKKIPVSDKSSQTSTIIIGAFNYVKSPKLSSLEIHEKSLWNRADKASFARTYPVQIDIHSTVIVSIVVHTDKFIMSSF